LPLAAIQQFAFCASKSTLAVSTDNEKDFASQNGNRNFGEGRAWAINQPHCSYISLYISSSDISSSRFRSLRVSRPILLCASLLNLLALRGKKDRLLSRLPQISMPSPHRQVGARAGSSASSTNEEAAQSPQDNPNASQHQEQHTPDIGPSHGLSRMEVGAYPVCKRNVRVSFESLPSSVLPVILEF
jgi:hypothetical protein